jgi:RNA polymerase sigma factor (sigma-70 family)
LHDALDLSQEAFVRAYRSIGHYDARFAFFTWFYRILRNLCFNHLRNVKRRSELMREARSGSAEKDSSDPSLILERDETLPREEDPLRHRRADRALCLDRAAEVLCRKERQIQGGREMRVTSSSAIAGKKIVETLGLVRGNTIRARNLGRDILAFFKNMLGGEIEEYTKLMAESREQALDRMIRSAEDLGANAVVDVRFSTSYVMANAAEILVYGTAVVVR